MSIITVWVIEDDPLFRQTITDLFAESDGVVLMQAFDACEPALEALKYDAAPEVILLDIGLPGMSGTEGARRLKAISPATQIIVLTIHEDEHTIFEALCAGASGYLLKNSSSDRIIEAVCDVQSGGVPFTPPVARKVLRLFAETPPPKDDYGLTKREVTILHFLSEGHTKKRIAAEIFRSPHTIDTHLRNVYAKLHVHSGIEAVAKALRERLI